VTRIPNDSPRRTAVLRARGLGSVPAWLVGALLSTSALPVRAADEPLTLEEETTVTDAALGKWLSEGTAQLQKEEYLAAALKFNDLVRQGDKANPIIQEGQYLLGVSLYELGLYQSAFTRFEEIVDAGQAHTRYAKTLTYLLRIARATGNDPSVLLKISEYPPEVYPAEDSDELHFLVGQFFYGEESLAEALTRFQSVSRKNPTLFARAKYLEGLIHVAQSGPGPEPNLNARKPTPAASSLKPARRAPPQPPGRPESPCRARYRPWPSRGPRPAAPAGAWPRPPWPPGDRHRWPPALNRRSRGRPA